ncbi:MAG: flippase-like domain-containing protein [Chloroflexota bacterium]|nr:flippase-like domain-containing protein [Chloroflexota bacterium]MDQ6907779.1 flippase-like domain-containing protein [Chloroflexota bacterium]
MGRLFRRCLVPLVAFSAVTALVLVAGQLRAARTILVLFPHWVIALMLSLTLLAEAVKIARWRFFVQASGIPIRWRDAATSLLAGQTATILHGGDLLRIRLATEHGIPPRLGVTISFAMWATDMMTLPLLALAGFGKHLVARWLLFLPLAIPVLLILLVRSRRFAHFISRTLGRFGPTRRYALSEGEIAHVTHLLTRRTVLLGGVAYAAFMRLIFAATLLCAVDVINDRPLRYETVLSAHALSTLVGAFSFLPGIIALGSLVEILNARGVPRALGLLISLINRLLGVSANLSIGIVVLLIRYRAVGVGKRGGDAHESSDAIVVRPPSATPLTPALPSPADIPTSPP